MTKTILIAVALLGCATDELTEAEIHALVPCNADWTEGDREHPPIDGTPRCERACRSAAPLFHDYSTSSFCIFSAADTQRIVDSGEPVGQL